MEIGAWLGSLGLTRYEAAFRENSIDVDVLSELTESDLIQLGVTLGDRKRLLKAIAALSSQAAPPPVLTIPPAHSQTIPEAERRPITVMFCDLVGSTGLAAKLDAEDWRELVSAYLDEASKAVAQFGGHVLKKLGDGLMALFGYPQAQENDAERAARAGLAILRALDDLNARNVARGLPALAARIGLETGPVVVDATGEVFGDAPNVAARVQSAAEPGTLFVTEAVQRQVAGQFVAEDKGPHELKGVPGKPKLYRLVRASGGGRRGGARSLTPLVGREEELTTLERRWERAKAGDGQFVQIVGEPGLGKSRLTEELRARLVAAPHTWVAWSSSQLLQNTPLHPISEWGRQRFGGAEIAPDKRLAELEATLAQVKLDPAEHAPLLAPLLEIPLPEGRAPKLAPEELRRRQLAATVAWLLAGARQQPIVLVFEDLHWADPTTLDLMKTLAERGAQAQLLIVATTRPEFRAPWATRSHHSVISLSPLDRAEIIKMVAAIAERHALSKEAVEGVSNRTGGVPLFVEEVTRLLLEGGGQTIPPTLQQSLAARLDRLGDARELAQIGAVLGREFSHPLLQAVSGWSGPAQDAALEKLAEADLLFVEGAAPTSTYRFKHALIQDAAYESLLKTRRQALHRRAAEALVAAPDPQPEIVAHHFTQSGQTEPAIEWWGKAGDAALRRSAFQEAISHLGKAIEMADAQTALGNDGRAPENARSAVTRAKLQASYGQALIWTKGYQARETTLAFARAVELAGETETAADRCAGYFGVWVGALTRGEPEQVRVMAERFAQEIEARPGSSEALLGHRILGMTDFFGGSFVEAADHQRQALRLYDPERHHDLADRFGQDPGANARIFLALSLWIVGQIDEALSQADLATAEAQARGHPPTTAYVLNYKIMLCLMRGDAEAMASDFQTFSDLIAQHKLPAQWRARVIYFRGWLRWRQGEREAAIAEMREGLRLARDERHVLFAPLLEPILAEAEADEAALARIDDALAEMESTGFRYYEAEARRIRGELLFKRDPTEAALSEEAFLAAVTVAQRQGARSFELRAALALARLYHSTGRSTEAHAALASALEGFPPTSACPEIAEALEVLAELERSEPARRERRNRGIRAKYAQVLMITEGHTSDAAQAAFRRIDDRGSLGRAAEGWPVLFGQWIQSTTKGDIKAALATAEKLLRDGEEAGLPGMAASALRQMSMSLWQLGRFTEARRHAERARDLYDERWAAEVRAVTGTDFLAVLEVYLAMIVWPTGDVEAARAHLEAAIQRAEAIDPAYTLATVLAQALFVPAMARRAEETLKFADRAIAVAADKGVGAWEATTRFYRSWADGRLRDPGTGIADLNTAWNDLRERGMQLYDYYASALLADLQATAGGAEEALSTIAVGLRICTESGIQRELANMLTLRGDLLSSRDPAAAEASYREAITVAREQGGRTFELLAALPLARLLMAANRPLEACDVLATALEGYKPTPEMPQIAEAQALLDALATDPRVTDGGEARQARTALYGNYAKAMMFAKGFTLPETQAALVRARESAGEDDVARRFEAQYGEWLGQMVGGDLSLAETIARSFLRDAEARALALETCEGLRMVGVTQLLRGGLFEARSHLERAIAACQPEHDAQARLRFGYDVLATAKILLAKTQWYLGALEKADALCEAAIAQAETTRHPVTIAIVLDHCALINVLWGRTGAVRRHAEALQALSQQHGMPLYSSRCQLNLTWAIAREGLSPTTADEHGAAIDNHHATFGLGMFMPYHQGALADLLAEVGEFDEAAERVTGALSLAIETGRVTDLSFLHRVRGDIFLRRTPADSEVAEAAYREALSVARSQGARTYELQAAMPFARLLLSTNRSKEAHDALASALEGFTPTSELPAIAEAHALLTELEKAEPVKAEKARRSRDHTLRTAYAQAVMAVKGYAAAETRLAYERAGAQSGALNSDHWVSLNGRWASLLFQGDLSGAETVARKFIRDAEAAGLVVEAATGNRLLGLAHALRGDLAQGSAILEEALSAYSDKWPTSSPAYGDFLCDTWSLSAIPLWQMGQLELASERLSLSIARATEIGHGLSLATAIANRLQFCAMTDRADLAEAFAFRLRDHTQAHGIGLWGAVAEIHICWTSCRRGDAESLERLRHAVRAYDELGGQVLRPEHLVMLAECEVASGAPDLALGTVDRGLEVVRRTGLALPKSALQRVRGDALASRDPAAAEAAYSEALAVAQQCGARTFGLIAALRLARLLQAAGRTRQAHDVLAPALEGFTHTPELRAIAEAHALLATLLGDPAVKEEREIRRQRASLHANFARAVQWARGFADEDTRAAYERASDLAANDPDGDQYWSTLNGRWAVHFARGEHEAALGVARTYMGQALTSKRPWHVLNGHRLTGQVNSCLAHFDEAKLEFEAMEEGWEEEYAEHLRGVSPGDVLCSGLAFYAEALIIAGEVATGLAKAEQAVRRAERRNDFQALALALNWSCFAFHHAGRVDALSAAAAMLQTISTERGAQYFSLIARAHVTIAQGLLGNVPAAIGTLIEIISISRERHELLRLPTLLARLTDLQLVALRHEDAIATINEALALIEQTGERQIEAALHRRRGDALLRRDPAAAEAAFGEAIAIARRQGARTFELQAALPFARLLQSANRPVEAYNVLARTLEGFTPTPELSAIAEAQALLAELGQ